MLNKIKKAINAVRIRIFERIEARRTIAELRAKEDADHLEKIALCKYLASRPAQRTIANAPKVQIKKVA